MKATGVAVLTALLVVGACSAMQINQEREWGQGYTPVEDVVIEYQNYEK